MAMLSDLEIYRAAKVLIDSHGENAALEAAQKADRMLVRGDLDGLRVWKRIIAAIEELQRATRKDGEGLQ